MNISIQEAIGYLCPVQYVKEVYINLEDAFSVTKKELGRALEELSIFHQLHETDGRARAQL